MYRDFGTVLLAALVAIVFVCVPLILQWLVAPSNKTAEKLQTYECGEVVEGSARLQFNVRFYVIALIAYVWVKSDLDWIKRTVRYGSGRYQKIAMEQDK